MRWAGHVAHMIETRNVNKILVTKLEGKRLLRRTRYRWKYNIRMDLRELGWGVVDWSHLAQDSDHWHTHVNFIMNCHFP
jgi:hypothetical protein